MDKKQLIVVVAISVIVSFIGGAFSASLFGGPAAGSSETGELVIVNDQGDPVISLSSDEVGPRIEMFDHDGKQRLFFNADAINTVMSIYGTQSDARVELGSFGQTARLDLRDHSGRLIWRSR
ncbi:MAG: hypothetical protein HYV27_24795 [Candidatus Hydrogenedentes bacterium]|nr:hypothetical protein [Candidatus Hydrogenedentota bacterium]